MEKKTTQRATQQVQRPAALNNQKSSQRLHPQRRQQEPSHLPGQKAKPSNSFCTDERYSLRSLSSLSLHHQLRLRVPCQILGGVLHALLCGCAESEKTSVTQEGVREKVHFLLRHGGATDDSLTDLDTSVLGKTLWDLLRTECGDKSCKLHSKFVKWERKKPTPKTIPGLRYATREDLLKRPNAATASSSAGTSSSTGQPSSTVDSVSPLQLIQMLFPKLCRSEFDQTHAEECSHFHLVSSNSKFMAANAAGMAKIEPRSVLQVNAVQQALRLLVSPSTRSNASVFHEILRDRIWDAAQNPTLIAAVRADSVAQGRLNRYSLGKLIAQSDFWGDNVADVKGLYHGYELNKTVSKHSLALAMGAKAGASSQPPPPASASASAPGSFASVVPVGSSSSPSSASVSAATAGLADPGSAPPSQSEIARALQQEALWSVTKDIHLLEAQKQQQAARARRALNSIGELQAEITALQKDSDDAASQVQALDVQLGVKRRRLNLFESFEVPAPPTDPSQEMG